MNKMESDIGDRMFVPITFLIWKRFSQSSDDIYDDIVKMAY